MSKYTYEEFIKDGCKDLTIKDHSMGVKSKAILLEQAKEYIEEFNDLYFFNFIKFERIVYWYWLITNTNFESIVEFQISDLSVDEQDVIIRYLEDSDICFSDDTFTQRTIDTMNMLASSMNISKIIREENDADMKEMKDMFRGLENMQNELDLMSSTIEEFNKNIGG